MTLLGLLPILFFGLFLLGSAFWLWMLVDCIKNRSLSDQDRIIWVMAVIFLHFIGALLYLFIARQPRQTGGS